MMERVENVKPEGMEDFFDVRHEGYDQHMRDNVTDFDTFYRKVSEPLEQKPGMVKVLDIGCGTGLELEYMFGRLDKVYIRCIDVSEKMLKKLREKYVRLQDKLSIEKGSYLEIPFEEESYDYVISVMSVHHFLHSRKLELYKKIRNALAKGGQYIEGDWIVLPDREKQFIMEYNSKYEELGTEDDGKYHIDVPFSLDTEIRLLFEAGFKSVEVIWVKEETAVLAAKK